MFLGLIFFLELTAGILAFVFKDWIKDQLNFFINNNVKAYRDDIDLQNLIDFAQEYVSLHFSSPLVFCCAVGVFWMELIFKCALEYRRNETSAESLSFLCMKNTSYVMM